MEFKNFDVLKNFGISGTIFNLNQESISQSDVYIIKQEKIKKNFSEGAICKIPGSYLNLSFPKAKDDMELYEECDQEYAVFGGTVNQEDAKIDEANLNSKADNSHAFSSVFDNYNDFCFNNNFNYLNSKKTTNAIAKNFSNFSTSTDFSNCLVANASKTENIEGKGAECPKSLSVKTFFAKENFENKVNNFHCEKIDSKENAIEINNYNKNNLLKKANKIILNKNKNEINENNKIHQSNKTLESTANNNNSQKEITNSEEELKNGIFKNSMQIQMEQLNRIFKEMNESSEAKVIIKAYKSKLKTKFYKIYESNSEFYKEKNKHKIFHKCNFPGCSRTFASAGWLKSHFNEHLHELKSNKFNLEFERSLMKLKHMNLLN